MTAKIYGSTEELQAQLLNEHLRPNLRKNIEVELAYRQREAQWVETRKKAHEKWLSSRGGKSG